VFFRIACDVCVLDVMSSVLSCRHVDEVIIGAPLEVTEDMIKTMNISVVVRGVSLSLCRSAVAFLYKRILVLAVLCLCIRHCEL
jgi:hypothetical protein